MLAAERKRRGGKKNKLEEIQKPRGYERELQLNRIVGATDCTGKLMFLVQWFGCSEFDLLTAAEVNEKSPEAVITFYEDRDVLNAKCQRRLTVQEQYERDLIAYPPDEVTAEEEAATEMDTVESKGSVHKELAAAVQNETSTTSAPQIAADAKPILTKQEPRYVADEATAARDTIAAEEQEPRPPSLPEMNSGSAAPPIPDDIEMPSDDTF